MIILDPISDLRRLRDERTDWLLSALTGVLILLIFCLRSTPGSRHLRFSFVCDRPVDRDHRRHDDHFQKLHVPRFDVDCPCSQCYRIFPADLLPCALPSSHIGRLMVDHRRHSGDSGNWSRVSASAYVTYHRIIGAILLYLLIAVAFSTLYLFVGLTYQRRDQRNSI